MNFEVIGIENFPIIDKKSDLSKIIYETLESNNQRLEYGDILVLAETVVSKAEGNYVNEEKITPSKKAYCIALETDKTPEEVESVLEESDKIIKYRKGVIISQTHHGFICANAGIDNSNCKNGLKTKLPVNPDKSATIIREYLEDMYDTRIGMIISDTQGRAFRSGAVGVAVGISGITPYLDCVGLKDLYGKLLKSTIIGVADELSSAASIIMGQANNGYCLVVIRGVSYFDEIKCNSYDSCIQDILRDEENDLFR